MFAPLIVARKANGFTDPQIVAMLAKHGIEISVETLRVYRSRLKQEVGERGGDLSSLAAQAACGAGPSQGLGETDQQDTPLPSPAERRRPAEPSADAPRAHEQPGFNRTITLDDGV